MSDFDDFLLIQVTREYQARAAALASRPPIRLSRLFKDGMLQTHKVFILSVLAAMAVFSMVMGPILSR